LEPTAKLTGDVLVIAIELNIGAGVVGVVVVLVGVVLDVDVDAGEQPPVDAVRTTNNPTIKQYPRNSDFILFTLILRFLDKTN